MVWTTCSITFPPSDATSDAWLAKPFAWSAFSAFNFTVPVSSSMADAVSSRLDACCSVRLDKSAFPVAISLEAVSMVSTASWILIMVSRSSSTNWLIDSPSTLKSPSSGSSMLCSKSPSVSLDITALILSTATVRPVMSVAYFTTLKGLPFWSSMGLYEAWI